MLPLIVFKYTLPHDASGIPNKKLKQLAVLTSIGIAVLAMVLSPIVIPVLFPKYAEVVQVIQIVSVSVVPFTIGLMLISEFLADEKIKIVLIGSGIFIGALVLSIFILGRTYGINGMAASMVLADSAETIFYYAAKRFKAKDRLQ